MKTIFQAAVIMALSCLALLPGTALAQDADADGMPDAWEAINVCLNPAVNDAAVDYDADGMTSLQEYTYSPSMNPCLADTDVDGMPDGWEVTSSCAGISPLVGDSLLDGDTDGLANLAEYTLVTNSCDPDSDDDLLEDGYEVYTSLTAPLDNDTDNDGLTDGYEVYTSFTDPLVADTDDDGMPDAWEASHACLMGNTVDGAVDYDTDGLTNLAEYTTRGNPCLSDTDADGMPDGWEESHACLKGNTVDGSADYDADGLTNLVEYTAGSNPCLLDTDADGMSDGWESINVCLMGNTADGSVDYDADGLTSLQEYTYSSALNPCVADTDGDGMPDGWEVSNTCLSPLGITSRLIGTYNTPGTSNGVYVSGSFAYVADGTYGLQIINVSNPATPALVGTYDTPGTANGVYVSGNYAYVADGTYGLQVIDVSTPAFPTIAGTYNTSGTSYRVYVSGDNAYVADGDYGLQVINVSNPGTPTLIGGYDTPGTVRGVYVSGNYAYLADNLYGIKVINVSNPATPTLTGALDTTGYAVGVYASGSYGYIADSSYGLKIINVENPTTPTLAGTYDTPDSARGVFVSGNYAYVADDLSGILIINVLNPTMPMYAGTYNTAGDAYGLYVSGNYVYVADGTYGLQVIKLSDADMDGLSDLEEYNETTNPCSSDSDGDGLTDIEEIGLGTDPNDPDTDGDGMDDGYEDMFGSSCGIDPLAGDSATDNDLDGLSNLEEFHAGTLPCVSDTDGDDMPDGWEVANTCLNPWGITTSLFGTYNMPDYAYGIDVSGNYAYVADNEYGLRVINISNQASPYLVGTYNTSGNAYGVKVSGNYAYVADLYSGLVIIDVSNPANPTPVGIKDTPGGGWDVYISGNYAYVADTSSGFQVIDVSYPASPTIVGTYDTTGSVYGVFVSGGYAYVADSTSGLEIFNVSNPSSPTLVGTYNTPGTAFGVYVSGNYAYVSDGDYGLQVINVSNPASPTLAGTYNTPGYAYGVYISGNYAYVADNSPGLQIIDVSNPASPTLVGTRKTQGSARDIYVSGNYVYVADSGFNFGLQVIKVSDADSDGLSDLEEYNALTDPCSPDPDGDGLTDAQEIGLGTDPNDPDTDGDGMEDGWEAISGASCGIDPLSGDSLPDTDLDGLSNLEEFYVGTNPCTSDTDGDGIPDEWEVTVTCLNPLVSSAALTLTATYDTPGTARGIYISDNYAYVADYNYGLKVFNISNPANPTIVGSYDTPGDAWGVYVSGNYAYVADTSSGLQIINVSNPVTPTLVGNYDFPSISYQGVFVSGSYAYVVDSTYGLQIINVYNPASPTRTSTYDTLGSEYGVYVSGNYAYVASGSYGLQVINVTNPATPTLAGAYNTTGNANGVYISGSYAYVADGSSGLQIINVSNPATPTLAGTYDTPGYAYSVYVSGSYAYVADYGSGLQVINVSNPATPTLAGTYDTPGTAYSIYVPGSYAYVADGTYGLNVIRLTDADSDQLSDLEEYTAGTDACSPDPDGDGLTDFEEVALGTDPYDPDTDGDGMEDYWEHVSGSACGIDPLSGDSAMDNDLDGLSNLGEYNSGTMPCVADTDGDGMPDGWEVANTCLSPFVPTSTPTWVGTYDTPGGANDVYVSGSYAYVADYGSGLQIINVSNPANPTLVGTYNTPGLAYEVDVSGNYAYVADYGSGLQIINVSNPANITLAGNYAMSGNYAFSVSVSGNYAAVGGYMNSKLINVTNPANPTLAANFNTPDAYGIYISGNYAYVASIYAGLMVINVANPTNPVQLGSYNTPGYAYGVYASGGYAYVADDTSGLQIVNVGNPSAPTLTSTYNTPGAAKRVHVSGNYAYVADSNNGLQIINVMNPANPTLAGSYDTPGSASGVYVYGKYAYVADGGSGLQIILLTDADSDGLSDLEEYNAGSSPCVSDTDGDGLTDIVEVGLGTDPGNADTDGDGMPDGWEVDVTCGSDPLVGDSLADNDLDGLTNLGEFNAETDPCDTDTDDDGLEDGDEVNIYFTNPFLPDTDGDGMDDGFEAQYALNPLLDDSAGDPDSDGLTNLIEFQQGSNPRSSEAPTSSCDLSVMYTNTVMPITFNTSSSYVSVELWVSYNDGAYVFTGLSQVATSGTFNYTPAYDDGRYRFYTIARVSPVCAEPPPAVADVEVMYDTAYPSSISDASLFASGGSAAIQYNSLDSFTGVDTVELFYRRNGAGAYTSTGLVENGENGFFIFNPALFGGDGMYQFFTLATDRAGNSEPMKWMALTSVTIDSSPPLAGFTVADGVDLADDDFWTYTNQLSAAWTQAHDPQSDISRYEYAIGTSAGAADLRGWTNNSTFASVTATGLSLSDGQQVFVTVRAFNGAGLYTEASSDGVVIDSRPPALVSASPADGDHLGTGLPQISLALTDTGAGIDRASLSFLLDFNPVPAGELTVCFGATVYHGATVTGGATCGDTLRVSHQPGDTLPKDSHVISVSLADKLGNSMSQSVVFYVDDASVLRISPASAELWPGATVSFSASGGRGTYNWSASGGAPAWFTGSPFVFTAGTAPGIYTVSVSDSSGASKTAAITVHGPMEIEPPLANLAFAEQQLFTVIGGTAPYAWVATGGALAPATGEATTYTAGAIAGAYTVTVTDSAAPAHTFSARVNVTEFVGRAIIVAGGGPRDSQWDKNEGMAKRAFSTLVQRGFTGDKIYFLSNDWQENWDGDFDGENDVRPALPVESSLQAAFDWAAGQVGPNVPLTVYLIDHGGQGQFQLTADNVAEPSSDERILAADELKAMLDGLQAATGCRVIVIVEACHSGSFGPGLSNPAYSRKLLMSSRADQLSFLSPEPIFSLYFWSAVRNGFDLQASFNESWEALLKSQWKGHQHAQADGNGDGVMGPIGLETLAGIYLGTDVGTLGSFPEIVAQSPDQVLPSIGAASGATVWAAVDSVEPIAEVYALVVPPGFTPPSPLDAGTFETPVYDFVKVSFAHTHDDLWEGRYEGFVGNGVYTLVIYAKDAQGQLSLPVETRVITPQPYVWGEYPARGSWGQAQNAQLQFHLLDAEDGVAVESIRLWIGGVDVTGAITVSGNLYDYLVQWSPSPAFDLLDGITVEVFAEDFNGNELVHLVGGTTTAPGSTTAPGDLMRFSVTDGIDNDSNGMPDDWEGFFAVDNPAGDPDLDGASNLMEFQAGTNPQGAGSTSISADLWEDDDLASWASEISDGGSAQAHNFHDTGDVDWVKFMAIPGSSYQVELFDVGPGCDPVLEVYDSSLAPLGSSNAGGLGDGESVSASAGAQMGWIYVKVRDLDPTAFGLGMDYRIRVTIPGNPFGKIYGTVKKLTLPGKPITLITSATVEVMAEGFKVTVQTGSTDYSPGDYFATALPLGVYSIRVSKPGYYSSVATGVSLLSGTGTVCKNITLEVVAPSTAGFMGRVTAAATGAPVANVNVWGFGANGYNYSAYTDQAGNFNITGLPLGNYSFNVYHSAYASQIVTQNFTAAGTVIQDLELITLIIDSDNDGVTDAIETKGCTSKTNPDSDGDGRQDGGPTGEDKDGDGVVDANETNPCDPDTDDDGHNDGATDCNGRDPNNWTNCAACVDADGDGRYTGCNAYVTIPGPDCNDANTNAWDTCATCADTDADTWWAGCNRYQTIAGPDCNNAAAAVHPMATEVCDSLDNQCPGDPGYGVVDEGCGAADTDGDGLLDSLEILIGTNRLLADSDADGISDSDEAFIWLTDPGSNDTDGDGMPDGWESNHACLSVLVADAAADSDGDGQSNQVEYGNSTNPCATADADGDGMSDWWENQYTSCGLNPAAGDSMADPDGDNRPNLIEYQDRTDPCVSFVAAAARLVNYQGRLTNGAGQPLNGPVNMTFSLFAADTGGAALWTEYHQVGVAAGIYTVTLGGDTAIPSAALALPSAYLQIGVNGEALVPRHLITPAITAINSDFIDGKRFETGTRVLTVNPAAALRTVHVRFERPFAGPPRVTVGDLDNLIGGVPFESTRVFNITGTGFDVEFRSWTGAAAAGSASFGYQSFGE